VQKEIIFKGETSEAVHSEHSDVWCWNLVTSGSRSETLAMFRNVVLEKEGKEHFVRYHEK
jgi:hypothetical protein